MPQRPIRPPEPSEAVDPAARKRDARSVLIIPSDPIAQEALSELAADRSVPDWIVEGFGDEHADVPRDLESIAEAVGVSVAYDPDLPPGVPGLRVPGLIILFPHHDNARVMIVGTHESSHDVFRGLGISHTHGDVWALTMALVMPRRLAMRHTDPGSLAAACCVPWWAARFRLETRALWDIGENRRQLY